MADDRLTYHAILETRSYGAPLLASGGTRDEQEKAVRESSGGIIFATAEEMPTLFQLINSGEIKSAVLFPGADLLSEGLHDGGINPNVLVEAALLVADEASVKADSHWQREAQRRLSANLDVADRDGVMDEEFAFLAAMDDAELDKFVRAAYRLLEDPNQSEKEWLSFLDETASSTYAHFNHEAIPMDEPEPQSSVEHEWTPLITADHVGIAFRRGALGGPRPLADVVEP